MATLDLPQAQDLASRYFARRERFADEDERTSFLVVVLNYGDHLTAAACIGGEWQGTKGDLPQRDGIPLCPNGHPLTESFVQFRLGLVQDHRRK